MTNLDSEDSAVEQPTIALLGELGWTTENCFHETLGAQSSLGRETRQEVVLRPRLRTALQRFNPDLPARALDLAEEELTRDRSALLPARANQEVYRLLKDGVKVAYRDDAGEDASATVQVIDWKDPESNDFFLASQLWIAGDVYTRRTDLIGFVNGLPLVFIELKASHKHLKDAYKNNLRDYRATIPQLFWYNAVILLSNGSQSRIGSTFAPWEHFAEWKKINSEGEEGIISLDTVLRGVCAPAHLLDLAENFTLFSEESGGLIKLVAKNHQFLGVNAAFQAVKDIKGNAGRLGVFCTPRAAARRAAWSSSPRRCSASSLGTSRSCSSPTDRSWTTRSTRPSPARVRLPRRRTKSTPTAASTCGPCCARTTATCSR